MKSFQLIRLNVSSYQDPLFLQREKESLESLGLRYCTTQEELDGSPLILLTNTHTKLPLVQKLLGHTQLILHPNSGYDNLSESFELIKTIPTVIGHKIRAHAVVDWILSVFFQASITRPSSTQWDPLRKWDRVRLKEKEVVVFGYGHIGKMITQSLRAIGVKVYVIDPYQENCFNHYSELEAKKYHALILCCGLNEKNKLMFNQDLFNHLGFQFFINSARGGLVNEKDLKTYLLQHPDAQAFLDVFEKEPYANEWDDFLQVTRSSHIAGVYKDLDQEIIDFEFNILQDFLKLTSEDFQKKYLSDLLSSKLKEGVII